MEVFDYDFSFFMCWSVKSSLAGIILKNSKKVWNPILLFKLDNNIKIKYATKYHRNYVLGETAAFVNYKSLVK